MSAAQKWLAGCGIGCAALAGIAFLSVVGLLFLLSLGPEGGVRTANNMEQYALDYLEAHNIVPDGERVLAYFDQTIMLDGTEAAILTDRSLIYHMNGANTIMKLADIESITIDELGGVEGTNVVATDSQGEIMLVNFPPFNDGPVFYNALEARHNAVKNTMPEGAGQ